MQLTTSLLAASSLSAMVHAADVTTSFLTLSNPGLTQTIPMGLDTSSTMTIAGWTVTGTATIISDVAVITDSTAVYIENLNDPSNNANGGIGAQDTNVVGGVTVIGGTIQGLDSATATASSSAGSSTPSSGASRMGGGHLLLVVGLGAAVTVLAV